ncbi:hypothetical protein FNV43_RR22452 [Rhamnella rubrinervis]|uniref:Uncharacterized protein n=1 Tax=Rhamnella rubrinervis TaxID=2594499 RepID=A0A8K0DW80_9ROSA|nr:hypothetical protein FNV43_RR22452 [Rhamnella rubrinervis]
MVRLLHIQLGTSKWVSDPFKVTALQPALHQVHPFRPWMQNIDPRLFCIRNVEMGWAAQLAGELRASLSILVAAVMTIVLIPIDSTKLVAAQAVLTGALGLEAKGVDGSKMDCF